MTFRRKLNDGGDVYELHSATEFAQVNREHQPRDRPVPVGAEAGQQGTALGAVQPTGQPPRLADPRPDRGFPRPLASLSLTVEIEVAQVRIRTESSVTNAREATVGPRQVAPVQRPAMHGYVRARPGALYAANEDVPAEGR